MKTILLPVALTPALAAPLAGAQAVRSEKNISLDRANQIAAIGVGGALGRHPDEQCAFVTLDQIEDQPK